MDENITSATAFHSLLREVSLTCNVQVAEVSKSLEFRQSKSVILGLSQHIQFIRVNVHLTVSHRLITGVRLRSDI